MTEIVKHQNTSVGLFQPANLSEAMELASMLCKAKLVPENYRGEENSANILIAFDYAQRMNIGALEVMQNMDIIQGKPSWSSKFIISTINSCGRFELLEYKFKYHEKPETYEREYWYNKKRNTEKKTMQNVECWAVTINRKTGKTIEGPRSSLKMAFLEGWLSKPGSKWNSMTQLMLQYRAAAFFGRFYCPDLLMGMKTQEEAVDIKSVENELIVMPKEKNNTESIIDDLCETPVIDVQTVNDVEPVMETEPEINNVAVPAETKVTADFPAAETETVVENDPEDLFAP